MLSNGRLIGAWIMAGAKADVETAIGVRLEVPR